MQHKYCIKFNLLGFGNRSGYFKGNNPNQALIRCLKHYKNNTITRLELEGDPLPVNKDFAAKEIIKERLKKENQINRWKGALKYQRLTGLEVYKTKGAKTTKTNT